MEKKVGIGVVLAVLAVAGWIGWTYLRFHVVFEMKIQTVFEKKVTRFPSVDALAHLPEYVKEAARQAGVPDEGLTTDVKLVPRAAGPITFWWLDVVIRDAGGKTLLVEHRIENQGLFLDDPEIEQKIPFLRIQK